MAEKGTEKLNDQIHSIEKNHLLCYLMTSFSCAKVMPMSRFFLWLSGSSLVQLSLLRAHFIHDAIYRAKAVSDLKEKDRECVCVSVCLLTPSQSCCHVSDSGTNARSLCHVISRRKPLLNVLLPLSRSCPAHLQLLMTGNDCHTERL